MIIPGRKYGNPWDQIRSMQDAQNREASGGVVHGMTAQQVEAMNARMESFLPQLASPSEASRIELPDGMSRSAQIAPGATSIPGASIFSAGGGGNVFSTPQQPYQPEFSSPDRQQYPVHRILANRYWRLFHKLDPVAGNVIDLYAEMLAGVAELTGDGVDGEIKEMLNEMIEETKVFALFPHFIREFMVLGEAVPHCFFDDEKGIWTFIAMHNPDQLEVIHSPFINMEPIVEYIPDDKLRQILSSADPSLAKVRSMMPSELVARLQSRQNIPLDPLNMTFIARKLHPYDTRGTSIYSRLWRIFMYEDAVFSASIATARRHAGPLKIAKLGNPATGWIPGPEHEKRLLELLSRAELDPHAFLVYHYGVQFEAFGTTDRMMSISREWDVIERMKLVALGVSKAFVHGEVTYASATTGLQVFLQRLLALRTFFETEWWYPKFFRPVAEINDWVKPTQAELSHNVRIRRTAQELREDNRYIIPTLMWDRKLDPHIDSALLAAIQQLEMLGVKISKGTKAASAGFNFEDEAKKVVKEMEFEQEIGIMPPIMPGMGGPGMGAPIPAQPMPPAPPPTQAPQQAPPRQAPPPPPEAVPQQAPAPQPVSATEDNQGGPSEPPKPKDQDIEDLKELLISAETDNDRWLPLRGSVTFIQMIEDGDMDEAWNYIEEYLSDIQGEDAEEIEKIRKELVLSQIIPPRDVDRLEELEKQLPDDSGILSDAVFNSMLAGKVVPIDKNYKADDLFTGVGRTAPRRASHSISTLLEHHNDQKKSQLKTPEIDSPENYKSREEWQKVLDRIPIPPEAKSYIKQMENMVSDGWEDAFEGVWNKVEMSLDRGLPITMDVLIELMSGGMRDLSKNVTRQDIKNALMGIYHNGKLKAYEPTGFKEKKEKKLAKMGMQRVSITIDTERDRLIIDTIAGGALSKVKTIGDKELRQDILERLVDPTHIEKNPVAIANEVVRNERERKEVDTKSREELHDELRSLYEDQMWKIERIMRTESLGAYWAATLRGYEEQGIKKIKFNAHMESNDTCSLCRGFNGTDFEVAKLLALPHPLLAQLTHPNCRCWPTPIITGLTFEEFEKEYMAQPDKFPESYHGIDPEKLTVEDVLTELSTRWTEYKSAPVEEAEALEKLNDMITGSPYQSEFPKDVQFVADVSEQPEFIKTVAPEEDLRNQIVTWTSPEDTTYVSMFSVEKGDASSTMIRTWAQNIWDSRPEIQKRFDTLYMESETRTAPDNIEAKSANTLATSFKPDMIGRRIWVGIAEGVTLNKKFRDMTDKQAKSALAELGIDSKDVGIIVEWRRYNPIWELESGRFMQTDIPTTLNRFVSGQAGESAQDMFMESMVSYVRDPLKLQSRDPETYEILKNDVFANKEFIGQ